MSTFICVPETSSLIRQLHETLPQALLLRGGDGVGLQRTAREIAGKSLVNIVHPVDREGTVMLDGSGEIRISQIRELIIQTRGRSTARRVIIIDNADMMNLPAQQAFLKLLEEPTPHTHFILTAHNIQLLLPTIRSRVQTHIVKPITEKQSLALIRAHDIMDTQLTRQLMFLGSGRPAELSRLIDNKAYFSQQVTAVEDARTFLQGSTVERLTIAQKYHADRPGVLRMLDQAVRIIRASLKSKPTKALITSAERLAIIYQHISDNANIRLQLINFVVQ